MTQAVYRFYMKLSSKECLDYYQGHYKYVQVVSETGKRIQLPAHHIRKFVTPNGINGYFKLLLSGDNKFIDLVQIG